MKSKKAITMEKVVAIIVIVITLLVTMIFIFDTEDLVYKGEELHCRNFVNAIDGSPSFFSKNLDTPNKNLKDGISTQCSSLKAEISQDELDKAHDVLRRCYSMMGNGENFLGNQFEGGICVYCGAITTRDEIHPFNEKFVNHLKDLDGRGKTSLFNATDESLSINREILLSKDHYPESFDEGSILNVYYYSYVLRDKQSTSHSFDEKTHEEIRGEDSILNDVLTFFGTMTSQTATLLSWSQDPKRKPLTGVVVHHREDLDFSNEEIIIDNGLKCDVIIRPKNQREIQ